MAERLRIGFVGAGQNSAGHIGACRESGVATPVAICDAALDRARAHAARFGIEHVYQDYREMLTRDDIDAVVVSIPNYLHHEVSIAALEAGKHVLCEKPMSIKVEWAEKMVETARRTGKLLQVGMTSRHHPASQWLKRYVEEGNLGRIYFARARYVRRSGIPRFGGWFTTKELSGGGGLIDIGVHRLDLVWYLLGCPKPVSVAGVTYSEMGGRKMGIASWAVPQDSPGHFDVDDFAAALIRFEGGTTVSLEAGWAGFTDPVYDVQLMGTDKGAVLDDGKLRVLSQELGRDADTAVAVPGQVNVFTRQMEAFVKTIRGEAPCVAPAEDGLAVTKMLLGIYESAEKGFEVKL